MELTLNSKDPGASNYQAKRVCGKITAGNMAPSSSTNASFGQVVSMLAGVLQCIGLTVDTTTWDVAMDDQGIKLQLHWAVQCVTQKQQQSLSTAASRKTDKMG